MRSRAEMYAQIAELSDRRRLSGALVAWRTKLHETQQSKWRHMMRLKMKTIKEQRELKLQKDAWAKWRQSYRSHLSSHQYDVGLRTRLYYHWKGRLSALDELEAVADDVLRAADDRRVINCWERWRKTSDMETSVQVMIGRISQRKIGDVMDLWRRRA
jgi:protein SFI1